MHCWLSRCGAGSFCWEIRRASVDAGGEHGGDGCGALSRDALREHSLEQSDTVVLVAGYFIWLKLALIVALALLFSCYTTPLLALLFTSGLYIVGCTSRSAELAGGSDEPGDGGFHEMAVLSFAEFENFNVMAMAAHGRPCR